MTDPQLVIIPLDDLRPHPLNPNLMVPELRAKLEANIRRTRRYPPLIVRPIEDGRFQLLDGEQRLHVLKDLGETSASCVVWECSDEDALLLLATLNRLEGQDVPGRRAVLVAELSVHQSLAELSLLLPESEAELQQTIDSLDVDLDALLVQLTEESERAQAALPVLFSFAVEPEDAPAVQSVLERLEERFTGKNKRGRTLVALTSAYLFDEATP